MRAAPALLLMVGALLGASEAVALPCTEDAAVCGRREFEAGVEAFKRGDSIAAVEHFKAAYAHKAHPVVLFNLALAEAKTGLFVEAATHFAEVAADSTAPKDIAEKAQVEKERTDAKVATVEVEAVGTVVEVTIDDAVVAGDPPVARLNPGTHKVRVVIDGKQALSRTVRLAVGERLRLTVDHTREILVGPGGAGGTGGGSGGAAGGGAGVGGSDPGSRVGLDPLWFYVGAGVTAVVGGVTVWSALDTKSSFDDYERDLPQLSQAEVNQRVADGHDKETRTNVLFAVSGIAALGTAALGLFLVDWKGGEQVSVQLHPKGAALNGRF